MQPSNGLNFNPQLSKKVFFYCQPSKRQININHKKVSRHFKECDFFSRSARSSGFPTDHLTSRNRKRALKKSRRRPANGDAVKKFQNSFGALLRMPQRMGCIVSSLHCKCQQMRFTRHKLTQNFVRFPVYFQTFLIFVQRSNYHWSCFRSMRKTLHHKFKNKYIMPQNVIECWLKCGNRYWIWCMRKCSFFRA